MSMKVVYFEVLVADVLDSYSEQTLIFPEKRIGITHTGFEDVLYDWDLEENKEYDPEESDYRKLVKRQEFDCSSSELEGLINSLHDAVERKKRLVDQLAQLHQQVNTDFSQLLDKIK